MPKTSTGVASGTAGVHTLRLICPLKKPMRKLTSDAVQLKHAPNSIETR